MGSSVSASARLFRGVNLSFADVVVAAVGGTRDDRRRLTVVGCAAEDEVVIDFRRGILDGDGGAGRGTVAGLIELRRRLGGILLWNYGLWTEMWNGPRVYDADGDVWTRFEHNTSRMVGLDGTYGFIKNTINFRFGT